MPKRTSQDRLETLSVRSLFSTWSKRYDESSISGWKEEYRIIHCIVFLLINSLQMQYKMQLDRRFKLPKLRYKGAAPRKQRIRKQQAPVIEEVDPAERKPLTKSSKASPQPLIAERKVKPPVARKQIHYRIQKSTGGTVEECTRIPTVEGGPPLTRLELEQEAPVELIVTAALTEVREG